MRDMAENQIDGRGCEFSNLEEKFIQHPLPPFGFHLRHHPCQEYATFAPFRSGQSFLIRSDLPKLDNLFIG